MIYFVKVHRDPDGYWSEFPDFNAPGSQGDSLEEVLKNSREALAGILESLFDRECRIPLATPRSGRNFHPIRVDDAIAVPILLRRLRLKHGLTLKQMAERLGIAYQSYQKLETFGRANPTLKTLRRVADCLGMPFAEMLAQVA